MGFYHSLGGEPLWQLETDDLSSRRLNGRGHCADARVLLEFIDMLMGLSVLLIAEFSSQGS